VKTAPIGTSNEKVRLKVWTPNPKSVIFGFGCGSAALWNPNVSNLAEGTPTGDVT
jgi:hypothetical protein